MEIFEQFPSLMNVWLHVFLFKKKPFDFWERAKKDTSYCSFVPKYIVEDDGSITDQQLGLILKRIGDVIEAFPGFSLEGPSYKRKNILIPHSRLDETGWFVVVRDAGRKLTFFDKNMMLALFKALYSVPDYTFSRAKSE